MASRFLLFCIPIFLALSAYADIKEQDEPKKVEIGGQVRVRAEFTDNKDLNNSVSDRNDFVGTRIRINAKYSPTKNLSGFIQPQYSGNWGQVTNNGYTSGGFLDPTLGIHQGYARWQTCDVLALQIGRQELAYGEHLIIGNVGYHNVGRSFDAVLADFSFKPFRLHMFYSLLAEEFGAQVNNTHDDHFAGAYAMLEPFSIFKAIDIYALWLLQNGTTAGVTAYNFGSFGVRIKHNWRDFDGRLEGVLQAGKHENATMFAGMINVEEGYTFNVLDGLRIAGEYSFASGDDSSSSTFTGYNQLFPTAHKWLGWLDFFGRRNIQEGVLHTSLKINKEWSTSMQLHTLWKIEDSDSLYNLAANKAINNTKGSEKHVGEELNIIATYRPIDQIYIDAMTGFLFPGALMKQALGGDMSYLVYVEAGFTF